MSKGERYTKSHTKKDEMAEYKAILKKKTRITSKKVMKRKGK